MSSTSLAGRVALVALVAALFAAVPSVSWAQIPLDVGIAVKGGVNVSGVSKPGSKEYQGRPYDITYPGFVGVGGQVGLFFEPRILDLVGVEIGFLWEKAQGEGDINEQPITVKSTDLVIPIHLRLATPGLVSFVFGVGVDFIVPISTDVEQSATIGTPINSMDREVTTYLGFGVGLEIDAVYIKVPVEFRGRWAAGMDDTYDSRLSIDGGQWAYGSDWEYQGEFMVGVKVPVDVL